MLREQQSAAGRPVSTDGLITAIDKKGATDGGERTALFRQKCEERIVGDSPYRLACSVCTDLHR